MVSSESDSDIESSDKNNEPSLNSEGVRSGGAPRKRGAIRNKLKDGEMEGDPEVQQTRKRHRVSSGSKRSNADDRARYLVDDEAEESGDEVGSDEDEESDGSGDEGEHEYMNDGFVVEDDGSDGGADQNLGSDVEFTRRKKKLTRLRRTHDEGGMLDDDDLALLQETHAQNEGVEYSYDQQAALRALNARDLESQLFSGLPGDEEDDQGGRTLAPHHKPFREEDYQSEEEEDFIEHDIAMYADDKLRKAVSFDTGDYTQVGGPTPDQLIEAIEIFGEGIVEHLKGQKPSISTTLHDERGRFPPATASAVPRVEPGKLQESFASPEDKIIQTKDWPERLQSRFSSLSRRDNDDAVVESASNKWKKESMWIYSEMKDIFKMKAKPSVSPTAANDVGCGSGGVEETGWGNATAAATTTSDISNSSRDSKIIRIIESILVFIRVEGMEVPFIFNHRPDSFKPELDLVDLWRIYDLDEKWESLTLRRHNISHVANTLWNKAAEMDEKAAALLSSTIGNADDDPSKEYGSEKDLLPILKDTSTLFPKELYEKLAVENDDETFLRDLQAYLSLVTLRNKFAASSEKKSRLHRAARQDQELYRRYRHIPELRRFALSFSIPAHQLGRFLGNPNGTTPPPVPLRSPEMSIMGLGHKCGFKTDDAALQAALIMLAQEIAGEPRILGHCRKIFQDRATLSSAPTNLGRQEIDYFHPLYGIHYIQQKPVLELLNVNDDDRSKAALDGATKRPVSDSSILFLHLERGQKDGLITVKINPPLSPGGGPLSTTSVNGNDANLNGEQELDLSPFMCELAPLYGAGKGLASKSEWEVVRSRVLEVALRHMMPQLIAELVRELRNKANTCVAEKVGEALAERLDVAPWAPANRSNEERLTNDPEKRRTLDEIRVVGIYMSPDPRQPSYAAVIDQSGVSLDYLVLPARREEAPVKLKEFLMDNRPHVVAVGASPSPQTCHVKRMLYTHRSAQLEGDLDIVLGVIPEALEDYKNRRDEESVTWYPDWATCGVEYVHEDVALVFSASARSAQEMPDFHPNHRAAVCLARYLQNPLVELAGMWMTMDSQGELGSEMLSLQFHPLQKEIPRRRLLRALEQKMIDFVNMVGVDVNTACKLEHAGGLIQFVAGLGPRKALRLKSAIQALPEGLIHSRQQFLEDHVLGPHVYTNASATLRVRRDALESDERLNPFDDTRIHPECYTKHMWARQICANALDVDGDDYIANFHAVVDDSHEVLVATLQHNEHWDPVSGNELQDKLEELDLEEFASDMERQGLGMRQLQLEAIKNEVRFPYRELRRPFQGPTSDQLFEWIIGETDVTLRPGVVLPIRITGHVRSGMKAKVEGFSTLYGFIRLGSVPDGNMMDEEDLRRIYPSNQVFDAAVVEVVKDRFEVLLSLLSKDVMCEPFELPLRFPRPPSLPPIDYHFQENLALGELDSKKKEREKLLDENRRGRKLQVGSHMLTASKLISRFRAHDNFRPCTYSEAEDSLRDGAVGDMVIRPSSKGVDYLGLTWMWLPNSFKQLDVQGKTDDDGSGRLVLWIEGEEYEDLDEVLARYITPCNDYISEMLLHEKYYDASREDCQRHLEDQKKSQPSRIPYLITKHHSVPAHFVFMYLPGKTVKSEYVKIMPGGYEMGKEVFSNIQTLIRYFKTKIQEKMMSRQQQHQQAHYSSTSRIQQQSGGMGVLPPPPPKPPLPPGPPPSGMGMMKGQKSSPLTQRAVHHRQGYSRYHR